MREKRFLSTLGLLPLILILLFSCEAFTQTLPGTISGIVTDGNTNTPLPGVNIYIFGTSIGTVSDLDGKYSITVKNDSSKLVFSFIGYLEETVETIGKETINMNLIPDMQEMSEVIVIGYGTVKKSDITGSVATVSSKDLAREAVTSVDKALQGKAAGVIVTQNNGSPGADATIRIRGIGTIGDSNPLYIVDGFPANSISNLNSSDIESMSILKDASATAIYGARAANGVVLITTKKGGSDKTTIEYNTYYGWQQPSNQLKMANKDEFVAALVAKLTEDADGDTSQIYKGKYKILRDPSVLPNTDFQKEIYDNSALMQSHQLSISAGNKTTNIFASIGYIKQEGIVEGSDFERLNFRSNVNHKAGERLKVGLNTSFSNSNRNIIKLDNIDGVILSSYLMEPIIEARDTNGHPVNSVFNQGYSNPLATMESYSVNYKLYNFVNNAFAEFEILKGLTFKTSGGLDLSFQNNTRNTKSFEWTLPAKPSQIDNIMTNDYTWLWENTLNYSFSNSIHSLNLVAGTTAQGYKGQYLQGTGFDLPNSDPEMQYLAVAQDRTSNGNAGEYRISSLLARVNYSLYDKYLITASVRSDASSRFGPENRTGYFPAFALAYKISNEEFMKSIAFISNLKLRAGWGKIGNDRIGDFRYMSLVAYNRNYVLGTTPTMVLGTTMPTAANKSLKWEASVQKNIGFDIAMLNNKITLAADLYDRVTEDMLLRVPTQGLVGLESNPWKNTGSVSNKGWEMEIAYKNYDRDFTYEITANFTHLTNEVLSLGGGTPIPGGPGINTSGQAFYNRTDVGHPIGAFYGYQVEGIWQEGDDFTNNPGSSPGDFKYRDLDGNDSINVNDMTYLGSPHPDLIYGFSVNLGYKGFDLIAQLQGTQGNDVANSVKYFTYQIGGGRNIEQEAADLSTRWTPENTTATQPKLSSRSYSQVSDFYIEDGSYLRLKNIQLGYTLPEDLTKKIAISKMRVYISAQNLFTWTKYTGVDPEVGQGYSEAGQTGDYFIDYGIDRGIYPQAKIFMIGANVAF